LPCRSVLSPCDRLARFNGMEKVDNFSACSHLGSVDTEMCRKNGYTFQMIERDGRRIDN